MRTFNELPEPAFFNPANAKQWGYRPDYSKLFLAGTDWVARHGIKPAATDDDDITLLLIDMQKDFCFQERVRIEEQLIKGKVSVKDFFTAARQ